MPILKILTNVARSQVPGNFLMEATQIFEKAIGKPKQYINIALVPDQLMAFGGTTDPCAYIEVISIGHLGVEENKAISKVIFDLIRDKLGITDTRAYISFFDMPRSEIGFKGTTFDELSKK